MSRRHRITFVLLVVAVTASLQGICQSGEEGPVAPQDAEPGAVAAPEALLLKYRVIRKSAPEVGASGVNEETTTEELGIVLGENLLVLHRPNTRLIYDFVARRVLKLDDAARTYRDDSLYSIVGFRDAEWDNRKSLLDVLFAGGAEPSAALDLARATDFFGLAPPGRDAGKPPQTSKSGKDLVYRREEKEVVRFRPSGPALAPHQLDAWRRFLAYEGHMHPEVRRRLVEAGCAAALLETRYCSGPTWETVKLTLEGRTVVKPPSAKVPDGYGLASDRAGAIDTLSARIAAEKAPDDSDAAAVDRAARELEAERPFVALLVVQAHYLQTGRSDVYAEFVSRFRSVPSVQKLLKLLTAAPKDAAEARRVMEALTGLKSKANEMSYVLDLFLAAMHEGLREYVKAEQVMLSALGKNPRVAGGWSDLGRFYYGQFKMKEAWRCWDTARRLYPDHPMLGEHTDREKRLSETYPDFF